MTRLIATLRMTVLWCLFAAASYFAVSYLIGIPDRAATTQNGATNPQGGGINAHDIDIALPDLDGAAWTLAAWNDGPMLINFWATWCPPCREEIPLLKQLQDEHRAAGLTVVGIAIDEDVDEVRNFADRIEFNYPILMGDENGLALSSALGASVFALPISVFVDRNGRITRMHTGEIHADEARMALAEILPR